MGFFDRGFIVAGWSKLRLSATCAGVMTFLAVSGCGETAEMQSTEDGTVVSDEVKKAGRPDGAAGDKVVVVQNGGDPVPKAGNDAVPGSGDEIVQIDTTGSESTTTQVYPGVVDSSLVSLQVKSLSLLRASIAGCFGNDAMTQLTRDMFAAESFLTAQDQIDFESQGKKRIFSKTSSYGLRYTREKALAGGSTTVEFVDPANGSLVADPHDVLETEAANLNDVAQGIRTTVSSDSLSDRYLRALEMVGQVVAHRCRLDDPLCDCTTEAKAKDMILRCMPTLEVEESTVQEAAQKMSAQCIQSPLEHRKAIASLVSSYAFAVRR